MRDADDWRREQDVITMARAIGLAFSGGKDSDG